LLVRVHFQYPHGRSTNGCLADQVDTTPLEVIIPVMTSRMEQLGHRLRLRIDARQVGTFMKIAINTRERQVVEIVSAAMFPGDNMLDVEFSQWGIILMKLAVFAALASALPDVNFCCLIHSLGLRFQQLSRLSPEDGDKLVGSHVTLVFGLLRFGEYAFGRLGS
jgi:hypothetical protein